jgi:hypothetical protein
MSLQLPSPQQPKTDIDNILSQPTLDGVSERKFFREEAKLAAEYTLHLLHKMNIPLSEAVILDLGCGGVNTTSSVRMSHYRPFYMAELAKLGFKPQQLVGLDIAQPDPNLGHLYTHIQIDLTQILNSAIDFVQFLQQQLSLNQLKNLVIIGSNNLFGNIAPNISMNVDTMFDSLLEAAAMLAAPAENSNLKIINFDGHAETSSLAAVYSWQGAEMTVDEKLDSQYRDLYSARFDN